MGVWYCTRDEVMFALASKSTAYNAAQIDREIEAASRSIERALFRKFYPFKGTRYMDWPGSTRRVSPAWKLWLDENELLVVDTLSSGGIAISVSDIIPRPSGAPPFNCIELNRSGSATFGGGSTPQNTVAITGTFGFCDDNETATALSAAITTVGALTCNVLNSAAVGVGQLIKIDSELLIVTDKTLLATADTATLAEDVGAEILAVTNGTLYGKNEVLTVGSERIRVVEIAGNNLIVQRAFDGSAVAAHAGATVYAPRTLTVSRGVLGTSSATHLSAAGVSRNVAPGPIRQLAVGLSLVAVEQENTAFARTIGSGEGTRNASGRSIKDLWDNAIELYQRRGRA